MLQRLKRREINRLIYPNLVSALQIIYEFLCKKSFLNLKVLSTLLLPYLTIDTTFQTFIYPVKDLTGEWYCYVTRYFESYCFFMYLSGSFFINFYRYMCVVHADFLRKWSVNIRVKVVTDF